MKGTKNADTDLRRVTDGKVTGGLKMYCVCGHIAVRKFQEMLSSGNFAIYGSARELRESILAEGGVDL
jgi:hypothetical protein